MATFPSVLWELSSDHDFDVGVKATIMEHGLAYTESSVSETDEVVQWRISHPRLSEADKDTIVNFLRVNFKDIQLTDPANAVVYTGKMISSGPRVQWMQSTKVYRVSWTFRGKIQ